MIKKVRKYYWGYFSLLVTNHLMMCHSQIYSILNYDIGSYISLQYSSILNKLLAFWNRFPTSRFSSYNCDFLRLAFLCIGTKHGTVMAIHQISDLKKRYNSLKIYSKMADPLPPWILKLLGLLFPEDYVWAGAGGGPVL